MRTTWEGFFFKIPIISESLTEGLEHRYFLKAPHVVQGAAKTENAAEPGFPEGGGAGQHIHQGSAEN